MVVLKSIGVLSCGKVLGILYALLGLLIGLPKAFFLLIGAVASTGSAQPGSDGLIFGTLFGVGAVIFLPILYGIIGFAGGDKAALLYNLKVRLVGGIELRSNREAGESTRGSSEPLVVALWSLQGCRLGRDGDPLLRVWNHSEILSRSV